RFDRLHYGIIYALNTFINFSYGSSMTTITKDLSSHTPMMRQYKKSQNQ
ncbi:MAG: hypothetical protein ACI9OE_002837, partial [Mariniflexile sp.]